MLFCLAGLLDDASQNEIRTKLPGLLRQFDLGSTALLLPQHISLKISFATDRIDDLLTYFDQLCLGLHPLQVTLRSLEAVAIEDAGVQSGLLWYSIGEDSRLREIHNQLNRDLPQLLGIRNSSIDGKRFRFHSTIAYGQKSYAQYQEICAAAASEFGEMRAWIDRLAVFCCLQDTAAAGHFFTLKISRLAKHNADQPILPLKGVEG